MIAARLSGCKLGGSFLEMADVFVIVRFDISQGDAGGIEVGVFQSLDEARRALDAGRASGVYVDQGNSWSGATAYELVRRSADGYFGLEGAEVGPYGLLAAPTIASAQLGGTWSSDPARRVGWPA
jgi:hypothetical protein